MNDLSALQAALNLVADAVHDYLTAKEAGGTTSLTVYENLLPDLLSLVRKIGSIPPEIKALSPADGLTLVSGLVARVSISDAHAEGVVNASMKLLSNLVPDITALVVAIKASKA